jgi:hypothetical protein
MVPNEYIGESRLLSKCVTRACHGGPHGKQFERALLELEEHEISISNNLARFSRKNITLRCLKGYMARVA